MDKAREDENLRVCMDGIALMEFEALNMELGNNCILDSKDLYDIHRKEEWAVHNMVNDYDQKHRAHDLKFVTKTSD